MIKFESVSKEYQKNHGFALLETTFQIQDQEFVFLVGPSGSGKSTLFKLLTAELQPTSGIIECCNYRLDKLRKKELPLYRRKLGVVFQDFRLIQSMTVAENLVFARRVTGVDTYLAKNRANELLESLDMTRYANRLPRQLSGGEQQRVAIARALMNCPEVILADEPTGNLDPETGRSILNKLAEINQDSLYGRPTVLIITHDQRMVDEMQKRVIRLESGRVISDVSCGTYHHSQKEAASL